MPFKPFSSYRKIKNGGRFRFLCTRIPTLIGSKYRVWLAVWQSCFGSEVYLQWKLSPPIQKKNVGFILASR